ncbi:hypothetical protein CEV08_07645 [Bartonella tribocorum]|uniref:Uncharacterized protein n=2 Tax=Bartonella tribocorum TaxID=85701 RepID=A0A2M6UR20_9HYPH|nr:hypothetical protein CEV08_07645 [Bartonella tribocorum]
MKIFKHCVLYIIAMAIFFSQVLGVNAGSLSSKLQDTGFISVVTQENGGTEAANVVVSSQGTEGTQEEGTQEEGTQGEGTQGGGFWEWLSAFFGQLGIIPVFLIPADRVLM